jgi:hypothetical protein
MLVLDCSVSTHTSFTFFLLCCFWGVIVLNLYICVNCILLNRTTNRCRTHFLNYFILKSIPDKIYSKYAFLYISACVLLLDVFLGALAKLRKATINFDISVHLSVRLSVSMKQLGYHWTYFNEILYLRIFRISIEKFHILLNSDKNKGYFTWISRSVFYRISINSSWNEKCFRQSCRENQNTHFMFNNLFF